MLARLKFEIPELVNQILDGLPQQVWTGDTVTFCDPAMAGGQLVSEIERRLLAHGHSADNVAARVFGFENNIMRVNYAKNTRSLVGNYRDLNVLEETLHMKFDVIIGNPPFTNGHDAKRWTLWSKFVELSFEKLSHKDSLIAMVTPASWQSPGDMFKLFMKHGITANLDAGKFFTVGSTFSHWQLSKQVQTGDFLVTHNAQTYAISRTNQWLPRIISAESLSINNKLFFSGKPRFKFKRTTEYHTSKIDRFSDTGTYRVFHTLAKQLQSDYQAAHYQLPKAMITLSGYTTVIIDRNIGCSQAVAWVEIGEEQLFNANLVLNSKLYQYLLNMNKWSGWNSLEVIKALPSVDLTRAWTDAKLYQHFGLTDSEIALVESTHGDNNG